MYRRSPLNDASALPETSLLQLQGSCTLQDSSDVLVAHNCCCQCRLQPCPAVDLLLRKCVMSVAHVACSRCAHNSCPTHAPAHNVLACVLHALSACWTHHTDWFKEYHATKCHSAPVEVLGVAIPVAKRAQGVSQQHSRGSRWQQQMALGDSCMPAAVAAHCVTLTATLLQQVGAACEVKRSHWEPTVSVSALLLLLLLLLLNPCCRLHSFMQQWCGPAAYLVIRGYCDQWPSGTVPGSAGDVAALEVQPAHHSSIRGGGSRWGQLYTLCVDSLLF
jgi:hypothetical protein